MAIAIDLLSLAFLLLVLAMPDPSHAFLAPVPAARRLPSPTLKMSSSSSSSPPSPPKTVVIAGAGVIGLSTSYYLAKNHGIKSIVVDPTGQIAPAASGKAGGFLALDWNDMSPIRRLARRSFALHEELADEKRAGGLGSDTIMYRRLTCAAVSVDPSAARKRPSGKKLQGVEWAEDGGDGDDAVLGLQPLGDESTIAQCHPKMLCDALWSVSSASQKDGGAGSELVTGKVESAVYSDERGRQLIGAKLADGTTTPADAILFATGPWTAYGNVITGVKYHSVLVPTPRVLTQSVFFSGCGDPEVYPRPDGTAYCTGFPDAAIRVTERPGEEEVREEAISQIIESVRAASGKDGALSADPTVEQACYLPTTPDGLPMMGPLSGKEGCYVAAGHGCWGILLGPGTGETMAELIATGRSTEHVDLRPFDPSRFDR